MKKIAIVLIAIALAAGTARATEYCVATNGSDSLNTGLDWSSPFLTISNALAKSDTTIVTVSNGTYNITAEIVVSKALTVRSFGGGVYGGLANASNTVVNRGGGGSRVFNLSVAGVVLDGLTITGSGYLYEGYSGGGVYMPNGGTVQNCIIRNNQGPNQGELGGGVYMVGGTLSNCIVQANTTAGRAGGSGVYANGGLIVNCQVLNNINNGGWFGGGGIFANNSQIVNCQVIGNTSSATKNTTDDPTEGGGIYAQGSTLVRNCLIANKTQSVAGASGGLGGGVFGGRIENCTIVANSTPHATGTSGGGVYGSVVTNSIVWNNTTGSGTGTNYGGACTFAYSCTAPLPAGTGNIMSDPLFVSLSSNDYRLAKSPVISPCINAGYSNVVTWDNDLDGNPRIANKTVDMGAYETFVPPAGTVIVIK